MAETRCSKQRSAATQAETIRVPALGENPKSKSSVSQRDESCAEGAKHVEPYESSDGRTFVSEVWYLPAAYPHEKPEEPQRSRRTVSKTLCGIFSQGMRGHMAAKQHFVPGVQNDAYVRGGS